MTTTSPIAVWKYQDQTICFTNEATNFDYQITITDKEIREFTNIESPVEAIQVERWISTGGFVPEVVLDFIAHSRNNWMPLDEDGNTIPVAIESPMFNYINQ